MRYRLSLIFLGLSALFFLAISTACQKNKTINVKLTVVDATTGEPVAGAKVYHEYNRRPADLTPITEEIGTTDNEGFLHVKKYAGRDSYANKLRISANGYRNIYSGYGQVITISKGQKSTTTKKLERCYHFSVSLKNENCFDETDSVWISGIYDFPTFAHAYTGCVDQTIQYNTYDYTYWTGSSAKTLTVTVKRNGVVTSFEQTTPMIFREITPININY